MKLPVCRLSACDQAEVAAHTPIINLQTHEYYVYIDLPEDFSCPCMILTDMIEIADTFTKSVYSDTYREGNRPWIRISFESLNIDPGFHRYLLKFINTASGIEFLKWVQYIIQDDNPDKPYVYMRRD